MDAPEEIIWALCVIFCDFLHNVGCVSHVCVNWIKSSEKIWFFYTENVFVESSDFCLFLFFIFFKYRVHKESQGLLGNRVCLVQTYVLYLFYFFSLKVLACPKLGLFFCPPPSLTSFSSILLFSWMYFRTMRNHMTPGAPVFIIKHLKTYFVALFSSFILTSILHFINNKKKNSLDINNYRI